MEQKTMKNKHEISMTSGSLAKNILLFSLPLMMSQILEVRASCAMPIRRVRCFPRTSGRRTGR